MGMLERQRELWQAVLGGCTVHCAEALGVGGWVHPLLKPGMVMPARDVLDLRMPTPPWAAEAGGGAPGHSRRPDKR